MKKSGQTPGKGSLLGKTREGEKQRQKERERHTENDTEVDRERKRETDTDKDREKDRETEVDRGRQTERECRFCYTATTAQARAQAQDLSFWHQMYFLVPMRMCYKVAESPRHCANFMFCVL